jgi:hypothetical protein
VITLRVIGVPRGLRLMSLIILYGSLAFFGVSARALADCQGTCTSEAEVTGLANPPAWAAGKLIHFEPESAAAAATESGPMINGLTPSPDFEGLPHTNAQLLLKSGNVQHSATVYLIFWGSDFESTQAGKETYTMLFNLYNGLSGSSWQRTLTQYFDKTSRVGTPVTIGGYYTDKSITAPKELRYESEITKEVEAAISTNKWTHEETDQFVVVTAPGTTYYKEPGSEGSILLGTGCAWHSVTPGGEVYDFVPYQGDPPLDKGGEGCVASGNPNKNPVDKTSKSASHEFAEAETDPLLKSWLTSKGAEVADICSSLADSQLPDGAWIQPISDNNSLDCTFGQNPEEPMVYNYAATGLLRCYSEEKTFMFEMVATVDPEGMGTQEYWFEYKQGDLELQEYENPTSPQYRAGNQTWEIKASRIKQISPILSWRVRGMNTYGEIKHTSC